MKIFFPNSGDPIYALTMNYSKENKDFKNVDLLHKEISLYLTRPSEGTEKFTALQKQRIHNSTEGKSQRK